MNKHDAPIHSNATNSNATKPQTERGNQRNMKHGSASGRYPESSGGAFRAAPSPSPSMSAKTSAGKLQGTVGSVRKDGHGSVHDHNPYPNGLA